MRLNSTQSTLLNKKKMWRKTTHPIKYGINQLQLSYEGAILYVLLQCDFTVCKGCVGGEQLYSVKYQTHQLQKFKQGLKMGMKYPSM